MEGELNLKLNDTGRVWGVGLKNNVTCYNNLRYYYYRLMFVRSKKSIMIVLTT